ncbi:glutamate-cysteine ligase [Natrinema hispanicum]|uniref:Glutamate-cysteine ligase n=1 Tax=Natrinema hispanicum TaxID=392421 RepID=A0A482Y8A9_9EURY|nr:glutamate-cysteine ligase [Natrinema hispanicum]
MPFTALLISVKKAIEVEYWVINSDGGLTTPEELTDVSEYTEKEFVKPLFELKTPPCETMADLRATFIDQLDEILARADELDKLLVPLGTPINCEEIERLSSERGRIQKRVIGTEFDYASYCAGTHIHFEQQNVVDQLNTLIALDPALALLNSSPYFQGTDVANSARAYLYRKKCYEDYPKHGQLWDYVETVGEWETRLQHRFEEFKAAAIEAGVDGDDVDANFSPNTVVWTPVRLRKEMPTVEWRSPDASLPSQILRLTREANAVMEQIPNSVVRIDGDEAEIGQDTITIPTFDVVCDYAEEAIHEGIESETVSGYLQQLGFDVQEYDTITREIAGREIVSPREARDLRVKYATRLKEDVKSLREAA